MRTQEALPRSVVSAILEKEDQGKKYIFMQIRWKPQTSPTYSGLYEIPAGCIEGYENVYDALFREVKEETNLDIIEIIDDYHSEIVESRPHDTSHVFKPFLCQQVTETNGGLPWIGFVFRCRVTGDPVSQVEEAKDPQWKSIEELDQLLITSPEKFFPLQYTALRYYVASFK